MSDLNKDDVIKTLRVILAACVKKQGTLNKLVLSRADLERAGNGTLSVEDRPDGSIKLSIRKDAPAPTSRILMN